MAGEIEMIAEDQSPEIRPTPFVRLGEERVASIRTEDHDDTSSNEDDVEASAGCNLPKPRLAVQCLKVCISVHVFILQAAVFAAGYAKKGEDVEKEDQILWINGMIFLMVMSTFLGSANSMDEPRVRDRVWKPLKFLTVAVLIVVNITSVVISYAKEGGTVKEGKKGDYANKQVILFTISSFISLVTPHFLLVKRDSEPQPDVEKGEEDMNKLKKDLADQASSIETLTSKLERLQLAHDQAIRENELLMSWLNRVD